MDVRFPAAAAPRPIAVVLASGGMDSCVTVAIAVQSYELALLHVGYGQRTEARELQAFRAIAQAQPGGLGDAPEQDVRAAPTLGLRP